MSASVWNVRLKCEAVWQRTESRQWSCTFSRTIKVIVNQKPQIRERKLWGEPQSTSGGVAGEISGWSGAIALLTPWLADLSLCLLAALSYTPEKLLPDKKNSRCQSSHQPCNPALLNNQLNMWHHKYVYVSHMLFHTLCTIGWGGGSRDTRKSQNPKKNYFTAGIENRYPQTSSLHFFCNLVQISKFSWKFTNFPLFSAIFCTFCRFLKFLPSPPISPAWTWDGRCNEFKWFRIWVVFLKQCSF